MVGSVLGRMASRREDCEPLAGKSTLNRLELSAVRFKAKRARKIAADFARMDDLLVDQLVETHEETPREFVLDIDATDFELLDDQEDRFFHGYYNEVCYLPVVMFVDRHPILSGDMLKAFARHMISRAYLACLFRARPTV